MNIAVIGSGVVGLSTASALMCANRHLVTVFSRSDEDLSQTVSSRAGAVFTPFDGGIHLDWVAGSIKRYLILMSENPECGVRMQRTVEYLSPGQVIPQWVQLVASETGQTIERLAPVGHYAGGYALKLPHIDMIGYLPWLRRHAAEDGVRFVQRDITSPNELFAEGFDAVINCAGLGARELAADPAMRPLRGQLLHVPNDIDLRESIAAQEPDGSITYVYAYADHIVLGGTYELDVAVDTTEPATLDRILDRARRLLRLSGFAKWERLGERRLRSVSGLRPARMFDGKSEVVRLELEPRRDGRPLIHNYGHGRAGVTLSWGCAKAVEDILLAPTDKEKLELVSRTLDLLPDFFYVHDHEMRFWYANQRAAEFFGTTKDAIIGKRLRDVERDPAQAQRFEDVCIEIMQAKKPRVTDNLPYTRRDGTQGYLRQHDIPFLNAKTNEWMLMGLSREVTAERLLIDERERAVALERELAIARQIQQSLRPHDNNGQVDGLEISGVSQPAAYAGGDFYDWGQTGHGAFMVGLGDVSGHGVGPALLAASCRAYARILGSTFGVAEAMKRLNQRMCDDATEGRFVTMAMTQFDPVTNQMMFVSAGHGPVYLLRAGERTARVLPVHMPPLGLDHGAAADEPTTITIEPGDALVIVTDGVFEARAEDGSRFGLPRLTDLLAKLRGSNAATIVQAISDEVRAFGGSDNHEDDVTIVAARRQ